MLEINYSHPEVKKDFETINLILNLNVPDISLAKNRANYFSKILDSTLLKPQAKSNDIIDLCNESREFYFRSVCVPPTYVPLAIQHLQKLSTVICTVIGFPNGYNTIETKCFEAQQALELGAREIDFVQNISFVKSNNFIALEKEYVALVNTVQGKVIKVILETSLLSEEEIFKCTLLAAQCGISMIKTSTGFGERGASLKDIYIIKKALDEHFQNTNIRLGIKASGGIRNLENAFSFIEAGATRLGTSNGKNIILEGFPFQGELIKGATSEY